MKYLTQYVSGGMSDGYVVVEEDGVLKAQKLSFNGTEAVPGGAAEAISNVGLFATGMEEPAYSGSGSGTGGGVSGDGSGSDNVEPESCTKFYKCASVDTVSKTWTGYELILQDGVYVVSDVETTGLTYAGFTPSVNTMYNEDATFIISSLFSKSDTLEGCVFAANMQSNAAMYNGNTITLDGVNLAAAPGYTDGTKALYNTSKTLLDNIDGSNIFADGLFTLCCSVYIGSGGGLQQRFIGLGTEGQVEDIARIYQVSNGNNLLQQFCMTIKSAPDKYVDNASGWYHCVLIGGDSINLAQFYVNGVSFYTNTSFSGTGVKDLKLLSVNMNAQVYMKDLQIYNRVLEAAEVEDLYAKAKLPTA